MPVNLVCFSPECGQKYATNEVLYQCPRCGGLLELRYEYDAAAVPSWKKTWRERRMDNSPINQSGVWRYREMLPFDAEVSAVTLREGNTPLLESQVTSAYAGLDRLVFKHQGFNPTGSFKDNGMTCGVTQARLLGKRVVACVSTGNTSASMAAYASAAGLKAVIFLPQGNISFGKLAQALEYGALTLQVEANFDEILALVRQVADCSGVYLLNSINPFRIEGQKTMAIEMADQLDWRVPDWVVMPGGNLGNTAAFGKGFLELYEAGLIDRLPRIAVIQAQGAAPFFDYVRGGYDRFEAVRKPETLATAIRIGDPVSWPKAEAVVRKTAGAVETVSEQEIADAKAVIGRSGIGCEPASAATLAGIRKMTAAGIIQRDESVIAILTGNVLKDPDYIYRYHMGELKSPAGDAIASSYGNRPQVVESEANAIINLLQSL
ncbi:MAG TPA: threonine synthase [Bryobacteraceae bacterium]|nr:threonine synthase [Bryobacteraceae bacterium]